MRVRERERGVCEGEREGERECERERERKCITVYKCICMLVSH